MTITWTDELDRTIHTGFQNGLSARQIGESMGVSRNAVLDRAFRLNICAERVAAEQPPAPPPRKIKTNLPFTDEQIAERISDARDLGVTWFSLALEFGVDIQTVRNWAIRLGVFQESMRIKRFTPEDIQYICDAWNRSEHVDDIAAHLGRTFGTMRQMILRLQREGKIGSRDAAKTRLLKQYGHAALAAGNTPREALQNLAKAKALAFASAIEAARVAKTKFRARALAKMREDIAGGGDRDACIFAARADGVTLEMIAAEFGLTRERIRQICNAYAQRLALQNLHIEIAPAEQSA